MKQISFEINKNRITFTDEEFKNGFKSLYFNKNDGLIESFNSLQLDNSVNVFITDFEFSDIEEIVKFIKEQNYIPFNSHSGLSMSDLLFKNERSALIIKGYNSLCSALIKKAGLAVIFFTQKYYEDNLKKIA